MVRLVATALIPLFTLLHAAPAWCDQSDALYSAKAIVTGQGEKNREPGFRDCLTQVLVRVSGDQRLTARPEMADLLLRAGSFVQSFSYRDRLAGKPIHDEQGTYDRPHDLTCRYEPTVIDGLLADFGSRPWLDARPVLAVFLDVTRYRQAFRVSRQDPRDAAMRDSFALAASALAMTVVFPSARDGQTSAPASDPVDLAEAARTAGADMPLIGSLDWSDADHGWVASWRMAEGGRQHRWTVRGVNFDEAFRVAIRGAAQILSGNGTP